MNAIRDEYDLSKGERGKFYNPNVQFNLPLCLEADVLNQFTAKTKAKGVELNTLANDLLKKDIDLIEGVK